MAHNIPTDCEPDYFAASPPQMTMWPRQGAEIAAGMPLAGCSPTWSAMPPKTSSSSGCSLGSKGLGFAEPDQSLAKSTKLPSFPSLLSCNIGSGRHESNNAIRESTPRPSTAGEGPLSDTRDLIRPNFAEFCSQLQVPRPSYQLYEQTGLELISPPADLPRCNAVSGGKTRHGLSHAQSLQLPPCWLGDRIRILQASLCVVARRSIQLQSTGLSDAAHMHVQHCAGASGWIAAPNFGHGHDGAMSPQGTLGCRVLLMGRSLH